MTNHAEHPPLVALLVDRWSLVTGLDERPFQHIRPR
jgi:hypothetical protein